MSAWNEIYAECRKYDKFIVEVREYDEAKEISLAQMRYLHGAVIPLFVDFTGDSPQYWENKLKLECGSKWFKPEWIAINGKSFYVIPSKKNLSVKDCNEWFQNIIDFGNAIGCPIPLPDPNWKTNSL